MRQNNMQLLSLNVLWFTNQIKCISVTESRLIIFIYGDSICNRRLQNKCKRVTVAETANDSFWMKHYLKISTNLYRIFWNRVVMWRTNHDQTTTLRTTTKRVYEASRPCWFGTILPWYSFKKKPCTLSLARRRRDELVCRVYVYAMIVSSISMVNRFYGVSVWINLE